MVCRISRGVIVSGLPDTITPREMLGIIGEEKRQGVKIPPSTLVLFRKEIVLHPLDIHTELQCMRTTGPERIVRELIIVKRMSIIGSRADASLIPRISSDRHRRRGLSRRAAQRRECRCGINR